MAVTNGYCTLAELKLQLGGIADTDDDTLLEKAIESASREIDRYCETRFFKDSAVVTNTFFPARHHVCRVDTGRLAGIQTTDGLVVKTDEDGDGTFETTLTISTDFYLAPTNAATQVPAEPWTSIVLVDQVWPMLSNGRPPVQVTAVFGWTATPTDVSEACLILAARVFNRKDTSTGVVGFDGMGATVRIGRNDPDVNSLLQPYRKLHGMAG